MKRKKYLILPFLALGFLMFSCSSDNTTTEQETLIDVSYGAHPQQQYDLYLPEGRSSETTKVIMLVHGGYWYAGDKAEFNSVVPLLKAQHPNHAIVNVNYVLATEETPAFPHQFYDIQAVVQQLTEQSEALQIKPEFGFIGASAGAHLSMVFDSDYDTNDQVKFVADIVGPSNLTDPFFTEDPNYEYLYQLLIDESAYGSETNIPEAVSPAFIISENTSPTLLFYGETDDVVPLSNAYTLENALNDSNVPNQLTVYGGGHLNDWTTNDLNDMYSKISIYIDTYLSIDADL